MMQTLDLSKQENKAIALNEYLLNARNGLGGLVLYLIIPPTLTDLITDIAIEVKPANTEFYLYGWYEQFKFAVYVDETLQDSFYLICNYKNMKVKVIR